MNTFTKFVVVALLLTSCGSVVTSERATSSGLASVKIAQTPVKDQGSVGFCWAYAMAGFIEAETLRQTGQTMDISEEAIALYRMAGELKADLATMTTAKIQQKVMDSGYEGWFLRLPDKWDSEGTDAFELVDMFGILTEAEWGVKFAKAPGLFEPERMANGNYKPDLSRIVATLDKDSTDADIIAAVAESYGKLPPPPGHKITLKSKDYVAYWAESASDVPTMIDKMKATLGKGITVPVGYGVTFAKLSKTANYTWKGGLDRKVATYTKMGKAAAQRAFAFDGGHAVLAVDFVNDGGREGAIASSALTTELAKTWDVLDHIVIKNSWNTTTGALPPGYYRIDMSYLLGTAEAGVFDIMVPRK